MRLIDAEEFLNELQKKKRKICYKDCSPESWASAFSEFEAILKNATTIDAEPVRHGHWELHHIGAGYYWSCSSCGKNPCIYVTKETRYCPNCGAKMDEVSE